MNLNLVALLFYFLFTLCEGQESDSWEDKWTYTGLQSPSSWGTLREAWRRCKYGKRQSPINIASRRLIYDGNLRRLEFRNQGEISGEYTNTGKGPVFKPFPDQPVFTVSAGPLSYQYRLHDIRIHFGNDEDEGSEHTIEGNSFQGEVHLTFWNNELYRNFDHASESPHGLAIVGLFLQIGNRTSETRSELKKLTSTSVLERIVYKGSSVNVTNFNIPSMLPNTFEYITYEGSMTIPPCLESVTWILINRPVHISGNNLSGLRELLKTKISDPQRTLSRNIRPTLIIGPRIVRTNIAHQYDLDERCYQNRVEHFYTATVLS